MHDLVHLQVKALIADLGGMTTTGFSLHQGGYSVGGEFLDKGASAAAPMVIDPDEEHRLAEVSRRKADIAKKCLVFTRKMSKAID